MNNHLQRQQIKAGLTGFILERYISLCKDQ